MHRSSRFKCVGERQLGVGTRLTPCFVLWSPAERLSGDQRPRACQSEGTNDEISKSDSCIYVSIAFREQSRSAALRKPDGQVRRYMLLNETVSFEGPPISYELVCRWEMTTSCKRLKPHVGACSAASSEAPGKIPRKLMIQGQPMLLSCLDCFE